MNPEVGSQPHAGRDVGAGSGEVAAGYAARLDSARARADGLEARARRVEIARLAVFVSAALALLLAADVPGPPWIWRALGLVGAGGFVWLVVAHRRLRTELRRARISEVLARLGTLRAARDWDGLADAYESIEYVDPLLEPDVVDEDHPYARDLDVFGPRSLRALLGPTPTPTGTAALRRWLTEPGPVEEVCRRQGAVAELAADREGRESRTAEALLIDRVDRHGWSAFLAWASGPSIFGGEAGAGGATVADGGTAADEVTDAGAVPRWSIPFARIAPLATGGLFTWWFFTAGTSPLVWLVPLTIQGMLAFRWKRAFAIWFDRAGSRAPGLRRHHGLFAAWESYEARDPLLGSLIGRLSDPAGLRASEEIRALERWLDPADSVGSMVHEAVSVLLLWDVHVAVGLDRWRGRAGPSVRDWFDAVGELEALGALATLAHDQPGWAFPTLSEDVAAFDATALGHPLLADDVRRPSDVRLDPPGRFLLVTGSNMSGKSTLLRSIGLAAVMAQAGSVVCARGLELRPLRTFTSMRIHDSLTGGVSLFMAELLRLKALVDAADEPKARTLLYLVDEVLQGTNSEERRVAARRIIRHLLGAQAIGAVTTHDLALHEEPILDDRSTKVHFREHVDDSGAEVLTFDYRLRPGLATSRNALRLLRLVGLDDGEERAGNR